MLDIDELNENEEEESELSGGSSRLVLWLIIAGLGILFVPLYLVSATLKESKAPLETELADIQSTLTITPPPNPTEQALRDNLLQLRGQAGELQTLYDDLSANHIDWPAAMAVIANYDPAQMALSGLLQAERLVTINGRANDETIVMAYADMLRDSARFGEVKVQAITRVALPTPTPLPTEVAGTLQTPALPTNVAEFTITVELLAAS
jgi:Tfp pilus assembly protein PilN